MLGGTGATGRHVITQLLKNGNKVTALVRSEDKLFKILGDDENLSVIEGTALSISDDDLRSILERSSAVVSSLGHYLNIKGIYGKPWKLVADSIKRICLMAKEINSTETKRVILMNTAGFHNKSIDDPYSVGEKIIIGLVRALLPPQTDNEDAANYLIQVVGNQCESIQWVVVRPDGLIDKDEVTEYTTFAAPQRSALVNPGKTSRINVAHFMAELASSSMINDWKCQTPVVYNADSVS